MDKLESFRTWIYRMEAYGTISGGTAEKVLEFIEQQQIEIERLRIVEQAYEGMKKAL